MRNFVFIFLCLFYGLSVVLFAQEESAPEAKPVTAIDFNGLKNYSREEILALIKTKLNEPFDATVWAQDRVTLLKTGYFKTVTTEEKIRNKYVRLLVTVEEYEFQRTVTRIDVIGLKRISPEQILANMRTRVGHDFDQRVFDRDIINLHSMAFSKDLRAVPERTKDGYEIKIYMSEDIDWYDTYQVNVRNGTKSGVEKNLKEQVMLSKDGSYLDDTRIATICRRIGEFLETKGYYFNDVQTKVLVKNNEKVLEFSIVRGPKLKIAELNYIGNEKYTQKQLIKRGRLSSKPIRKYALGNVYYQNKLEEDKVRLLYFYNMNGYINAKLEQDEFIYNGSKDRLYLTFHINEGPRYFISDVNFIGNTLFEKEDLLSCISFLPGNHFNARAIYDDAKSIEGLYGDEGRLFTVVDPKLTYDTDRHTVSILYSIKESGIAKIGKVFISGNDVTKETVFLKELLIFPGDTYDRYKFEKSKASIMRLPFVDSQELKMEVVQSEEDVGDIYIDIKEKQSGNLTFRLMYSDIDELSGGVTLSESNFNWKSLFGEKIKGGGQYLALQAEGGMKSQRYNFIFTNPMIFDIPIRYNFNTYFKEFSNREFSKNQLGGTTSLSTRILGDLWWGGGYRYEKVSIKDIDEDVADEIKREKPKYSISAFFTFFSYDKRNNVYIPSAGYSARVEETVSETFSLGDRKFTSTSLDFSSYWSVANKIDDTTQKKYPYYFAFHFGAEASFSYGGDFVPLTERYFAGGNTSVRGFKPNRLGPKDDIGRLYPGNFRVVGNFEFNIPIFQDIVYVAPFVDAGYVWSDIQDFSVDDFRVSTGVTFKFRLPALQGQPILLTFAAPLHENNDEKQYVAFSFMTAF